MAGEDDDYVDRVRRLPCCAAWSSSSPCSGPVVAHHAGTRFDAVERGGDRRAHDSTAVPLCDRHHKDWHAASGPFRGWDKARRREWSDGQIEATRRIAGWRTR